MEEKNVIKIHLSTVLLFIAIIVIAIMGFFIYKLNVNNTNEIKKSAELQSQVNTLTETTNILQEKLSTISETISSNTVKENDTNTVNEVSNSDNKTNDFKDVILDGKYTASSGDVSWDFSKDGKAAYGTNSAVYQGTYKTIKENYVEIHYTKSKVWDDITSEVTIEDIDEYEYISIDSKNNINLTTMSGEKIKLKKTGEVVKENFE